MTAIAAALPELGGLPDFERPSAELLPLGTTVNRSRLLQPLCRPDGPPLVVLIAPAGYGKTTLLEQWAARDPRPFVWLAVGPADDDPEHLERRIARATARLRQHAPDGRFVLVIDDLHAVGHPAALDVLAGLPGRLPAGATLAAASRCEPPLPIARMRAQRRVEELRARELAMTRPEAAALFNRAGVELERSALTALLSRTEGWPAGLALAALALAEQGYSAGAVERFGGEERLVADYLRDEMLATLDPEARRFVRRTSVLEILTGPLCDAVLGRSGSAGVLAELVRANVLIVPMDRTDQHFRYHRLLAQTLRAELRRVEPRLEPELHRRASEWCREAGDVDRGLSHALVAQDVDAAADILRAGAGTAVAQGRNTLVERWLAGFTTDQIAARPALSVAAAASALVCGDGDLAEHWRVAAVRAAAGSRADDELDLALLTLRAALGGEGVAGTREQAMRAYSEQAGGGAWHALACLLAGTADAVLGEPEQAVRRLQEGAHMAAVTAPHLHALCLAQLAVLRLVEDDWEGAAALVARARAQVDRYSLAADATTALVFAVSAVVRARRGRVDEARGDLEQATRLAESLVDLPLWYDAELRILMARAAVRLSDVAGARVLLAHAARCLDREPDAIALAEWLREVEAQCDAFNGGASAEIASLTTAELRILGYLPTHLSFREIAQRTFVSANTVKTQANAVYRKLDVSSRSEAVARAREMGLIDA